MGENSPKRTTSDVWVEQRVLVKICMELGKTPGQTIEFIISNRKRPSVSRDHVYKWYRRFHDGRVETTEYLHSERLNFINNK
jgi:hypothetical protein